MNNGPGQYLGSHVIELDSLPPRKKEIIKLSESGSKPFHIGSHSGFYQSLETIYIMKCNKLQGPVFWLCYGGLKQNTGCAVCHRARPI